MVFSFSAHIVFAESSSDDEPELQFLPVDDDVLPVRSSLAVDEIFTPSPPPTNHEDIYNFIGSDDGTWAVTLHYLYIYFIFNEIMLVSEVESSPTMTPNDVSTTQTSPTETLSVSPVPSGAIATENAADEDELLLRPKRLTIAEKLLNSTDTQVRPVHLFNS